MHRPGVEYCSNTAASSRQLLPPAAVHPPKASASSSGPPSLSRTSTADFCIPSDDDYHGRHSLHAPLSAPFLHRRETTLPPPDSARAASLTSSSASSVLAPMARLSHTNENRDVAAQQDDIKRQLAQQQQRLQQEEESRVARLQAAWARERIEHENSLSTLHMSLARERALRTAAEQDQRSAQTECNQLRVALRALLTQPPAANGGSSGVPLGLYDDARRLLLRAEQAFADLKALQVKATDAAGLELLRRYSAPALEDIPPAWPPTGLQEPVVPRNGAMSHSAEEANPLDGSVSAAAASTPTVHSRAAAAAATHVEETPTGPEVSALTTVSPATPCSPLAPSRAPLEESVATPLQQRLVDARNADPEDGEVETSNAEKGWPQPHDSTMSTDPASTYGNKHVPPPPPSQRTLLSPPLATSPLPSQANASAAPAPRSWAGPMHEFAEDAAARPTAKTLSITPQAPQQVPSERLHPKRGSALSELDREDIVRDTDRLIRQLSAEALALANSQGMHSSSEVASLCHRRGLDYIDAAFLPVTETLGLASGSCRGYDPERGMSYLVQWCARDAITPRDRPAQLLTSAGVDPNALRCGRLGDVGVVAALAALAEAAGAVTSVLASTTSEEEEHGLYVVWLCVSGWWVRVTVDAYLPCVCEPGKPPVLFGCSHATTYDLWGPVCEKALAKVRGSYQALCHLSADAVLGHLTGGPVERWDWWRRRSETALEEMEAAVNTNARGAGIVLLTTYTTTTLQNAASATSSTRSIVAGTNAVYQRLGLLPGTAYRVLAVTDNADGEPVLLLRNWTSGARREATALASAPTDPAAASGERRDVSPLRDDGGGPLGRGISSNGVSRHGASWLAAPQTLSTAAEAASSTTATTSDACLWLSYTREVLPFFDTCHVCFDCRRYHDVRFPIEFSGTTPAVPSQLIRVRVQDRRATGQTGSASNRPTRLWVGLHQPCGSRGSSSSSSSGGGAAASPWGLKLTLIGQEDAPALYTAGSGSVNGSRSRARPARRSYLLSESFLGEMQALPAVWMYLELDAPDALPCTRDDADGDEDDREATTEFFIVPQMEVMDAMGTDGVTDNSFLGPSARGSRKDDLAQTVQRALWSRQAGAALTGELPFGSSTTAVVALLAEHKDSVRVDVVHAPEELRAAVYHDVVDRIDFSECTPIAERRAAGGGAAREQPGSPYAPSTTSLSGAPTVAQTRCQLNGRCMTNYTW